MNDMNQNDIFLQLARNNIDVSRLNEKFKSSESNRTPWLNKWNIPFDELLFAKPHVDYFIDDKGYRFENWADTYTFLLTKEQTNV